MAAALYLHNARISPTAADPPDPDISPTVTAAAAVAVTDDADQSQSQRHIRHLSAVSEVTRRASTSEASSSQQQPLLRRPSSGRRKRKRMNAKGKETFWKHELPQSTTRGGEQGVGGADVNDSSAQLVLERRSSRWWRRGKGVVESVLGIWSTYSAVRYFIAYARSTAHDTQAISLALGLSSALSVTLILTASLTHYSRHFLHEEGIPLKYLLILQILLQLIASFLLLAPPIVNFVLVFIWKSRLRCHLDVDLVWSLSAATATQHSDCQPRSGWPVWLGLSILRLTLTFILTALYLILCRRHILQPFNHHPRTPAVPHRRNKLRTRHRSDLSNQSTSYQSSSASRPLSTTTVSLAHTQLTTPPGGLQRHASSPPRAHFVVDRTSPRDEGDHDHDHDEEEGGETPSPPGLPVGGGAGGVAGADQGNDASGGIDEHQLSMFAERFRNLVAQITRETDEGLNLSRSQAPASSSSSSPRHGGGERGISPPPIHSLSVIPPHPFSSAYYAEDLDEAYYHQYHSGHRHAHHQHSHSNDSEEDSSDGGEDELDFDELMHYGRYDRFGRAVVGGDIFDDSGGRGGEMASPSEGGYYSAGLEGVQGQEHIRILGSYIRRMSTIESLGSRERMSESWSVYSSRRGGNGAGGAGAHTGGGTSRRNSVRSLGVASSLASMSMSGGNITRPPTRNGVVNDGNGSVGGGSEGGGGPSRSNSISLPVDRERQGGQGIMGAGRCASPVQMSQSVPASPSIPSMTPMGVGGAGYFSSRRGDQWQQQQQQQQERGERERSGSGSSTRTMNTGPSTGPSGSGSGSGDRSGSGGGTAAAAGVAPESRSRSGSRGSSISLSLSASLSMSAVGGGGGGAGGPQGAGAAPPSRGGSGGTGGTGGGEERIVSPKSSSSTYHSTASEFPMEEEEEEEEEGEESESGTPPGPTTTTTSPTAQQQQQASRSTGNTNPNPSSSQTTPHSSDS